MRKGEWISQYRNREAILKAKIEKGGNSAATWFLKGETTCTTSCSATPNSELKKSISSSLRKDRQADGGQTLVVEEGGLPVTIGLRVKNPFRKDICVFKDPEYPVYTRVDCSRQDTVYSITCGGCLESVFQGPSPLHMPKPTEAGGETRLHYIGMTGTSMHTRGKSHLTAMKRLDKSNALARHIIEKHSGKEQLFNMKMCTFKQNCPEQI